MTNSTMVAIAPASHPSHSLSSIISMGGSSPSLTAHSLSPSLSFVPQNSIRRGVISSTPSPILSFHRYHITLHHLHHCCHPPQSLRSFRRQGRIDQPLTSTLRHHRFHQHLLLFLLLDSSPRRLPHLCHSLRLHQHSLNKVDLLHQPRWASSSPSPSSSSSLSLSMGPSRLVAESGCQAGCAVGAAGKEYGRFNLDRCRNEGRKWNCGSTAMAGRSMGGGGGGGRGRRRGGWVKRDLQGGKMTWTSSSAWSVASLASNYADSGNDLGAGVDGNEVGALMEFPSGGQVVVETLGARYSAGDADKYNWDERQDSGSSRSAKEESVPINGILGVNRSTLPGLLSESRISLPEIMAPVTDDLDMLKENLKTIVGERHPMLLMAADQIFSAGGKRLRPALVFLVSRATAELGGLENLLPQHRRLAEITEMIHTASLVHDDVLDDSDVRRGVQTVHSLYGTRVAVLVGDFLFAQSSWYLANLNNLEVIKLISQVIADFANGEIQQAASLFDCDLTLEGYMEKSYFKTASLMAASAKSGAVFSGVSESVKTKMFDYGKHLGLAFQVVDDILDFTQSTQQLGKPAGSDLASGNLTAPALFALRRQPELRELILSSDFATSEVSINRAVELVTVGGGISDAQQLAKEEGEKARRCLDCLPRTRVRQSLEGLVDYVLERLY